MPAVIGVGVDRLFREPVEGGRLGLQAGGGSSIESVQFGQLLRQPLLRRIRIPFGQHQHRHGEIGAPVAERVEGGTDALHDLDASDGEIGVLRLVHCLME